MLGRIKSAIRVLLGKAVAFDHPIKTTTDDFGNVTHRKWVPNEIAWAKMSEYTIPFDAATSVYVCPGKLSFFDWDKPAPDHSEH